MTGRVNPIPAEARVFQGRRAGLVTRGAAAAVDIAVVAATLMVAYLAFCVLVFFIPPGGFETPVPPLWLDIPLSYLAMTLYLAFAWHSIGRSYGGLVMGLRVVDHSGRHVSIVPALLRAAFCVAFPLGWLWIAVSRANRSVQDVVLRTSVIYDWEARRPGASAARRAGEQDAKQPVDVDIGQMDEAAEEDSSLSRGAET